MSDLDGRSILVTGADGRIGSAACAHLSRRGARVTALSLPASGDHVEAEAERVVQGDCTEPETVAEAMDGVEQVVHLAAIPSPELADWTTVFRTNVVATFTVLARAGELGLRRAVIASSINAYGGPYSSHDVLPAYYPMDERVPADLDDPYSLSKATDEATARMAHRHWGLDVVALRFPFTADAQAVAAQSAAVTGDPAHAATECWSYLDVRDAARAVEAGLTAPVHGAHPVLVAADTTLVPFATEDLLDRHAPRVPRLRTFVGREVPMDLTAARTLLGFRAVHVLDLPTRPLP